MKSLANEERLAIFSSVEKIIQKELVLVNDSFERKRVEQAGDFFEEVVNGMHSIIKKDTNYILANNLKKMLEFSGYSFMEYASQQTEELQRAIAEFSGYLKSFRELEDNPKRFYSGNQWKQSKLLEACNKMKNFYQRLVDEEDFHELETPDY